VNPGLLLAFWGLTVVLIVIPGPDWAFTLASGVRDRVVFPAVAGLMLGYAVITVVVAAGVGAIVTRTPVILTALTGIGAAYLAYLGLTLLVRPAAVDHAAVRVAGPPSYRWGHVVRGVGVSGLNPKGLLLFLAILPQFTDPDHGWPVPAQLAALGLVFVVTCGVFYTGLGLCARSVLRSRPGASRAMSRLSGAAMIVIGALLLIERLLGR
jgi:threonine/homoserine/homoserine lactone efflux protein